MIKTKQDRILNTFDAMFPDARCVLNHSNNLELLVAVMLSAQTTDEAVNKLTSHLFKKYQTVEDYANASLPELESDLHSIGLYRNKAKNIKAMAEALQTRFNGVVPASHDALISLPGVGRKTANVVMAEGFIAPQAEINHTILDRHVKVYSNAHLSGSSNHPVFIPKGASVNE